MTVLRLEVMRVRCKVPGTGRMLLGAGSVGHVRECRMLQAANGYLCQVEERVPSYAT